MLHVVCIQMGEYRGQLCAKKVLNFPGPLNLGDINIMVVDCYNSTAFFKKKFQLEKRDVQASQTLRAALSRTETANPGFAYDFVVGIMRQGELSVNMNESILRLQGAASDVDGKDYY
jgi:Protein of unknown function (DUF1241).